VLVVDDNDDTREALCMLLRLERFDVSAAPSGVDALEIPEAGLRPCVVLLDIRMRGIDGWEVTARPQSHAELQSAPRSSAWYSAIAHAPLTGGGA